MSSPISIPYEEQGIGDLDIDSIEEETEESKDFQLRVQAGLTPAGINEDGEEEWIGDDKEWDAYEKLKIQHE